MNSGGGDENNADSERLTFTYNSLKQLSRRTSPNLQIDYTYKTISGNRVSSRVASIGYMLKNGSTTTKEKSLGYYYDDLVNIKIVDDGTQKMTYAYASVVNL